MPFEQEKVFEFVTTRLISGDYSETFKALSWLHVNQFFTLNYLKIIVFKLLSRMNIRISLSMLLDWLMAGLNKLHSTQYTGDPALDRKTDSEIEDGPLTFEVLIIDIIAQQVIQN